LGVFFLAMPTVSHRPDRIATCGKFKLHHYPRAMLLASLTKVNYTSVPWDGTSWLHDSANSLN
jgi:hypothetical protein